MKYNYKFNVLRFLLVLSLFGLFTNSQLRAQGLITNTTYIVNGGNDLVAPVDTFANLTGSTTGPAYGALSFLNQFGMNSVQSGTGPVIFLLAAGYNPVESNTINIGQPSGAGGWPNMYWNANSPIVIKPAVGQNFIITTSAFIGANQALVRFNGAWYASIDGASTGSQRNLTFSMPASATQTTSRVIDILPTSGNRIQSVGVRNCNIVGNSNSFAPTTFAGIYFGGIGAGSATALGQNQNIDVINNYVIAVQNGIYFRGLANVTNLQNKNININNNMIGDYVNALNPSNTAFIGGLNGTGIYVNAVANAIIDNNTIRNTVSTSANFKGIFLTSEGGFPGLSLDSNVQVTNNNIYNINATNSGGVSGIRISLGTHSQHLRLLVANNSISKLAALNAQAFLAGFAYPIGILVEDISTNVGLEVFYNSVNLTGSTLPSNSFSACFATGSGTSGGIIMMNNSFANSMGRPINNINGYTVYNVLTLSTTSPFRYSSFNNYYTTTFDGGNAFTARFLGRDLSSLKGFTMYSRSDTTSYSTIPPFKNDSDLTVNNGVNHWTFNKAASLPLFFNFYQSIFDSIRFKVNTDIFGTPRNNMGRFSSIGFHLWVGDSVNIPVAVVAPRVFPINGFTQRPTLLNLNGSFATIAEAVDHINHYGVGGSGDIVMELQPGYNGESVHIPAFIDYPNSNLGRPVVFRTAANFSTTVSVPNNASMNNLSILRFMGANWVRFEGGNNKGLTFAMPSNAINVNTRIISFTPVDTASNNITIRNCKLIGNSNTVAPFTGMGIYAGNFNIFGAPTAALKTGLNNISLIGNEIFAVRSGIVFFGAGASTNALFRSNIIGGNITTGGPENTTFIGGATNQYGILLKGMTASDIDSNVVRNCVSTFSSSNGFFGIFLDEAGSTNLSGISVTRNFVYNLITNNGTYCAGIRINLSGSAGSRGITLINNFVGRILGNGTFTNFSNLNPAGISIDAAGALTGLGIAIGHNTINLNGNGLGASGSGSAALFLGANIQGGIEINNNIFGNRINRIAGTGNRYAVLIGHNATPFTTATVLPFPSNNNNYFAVGNGNNFVAGTINGTINRANINDWRAFTAPTPALAGMDGSSFNWVSTFKTDTTPDVNLLYGGLVPGGANIVSGICNDIYGNPRFQCSGGSTTSTRWVGAAEVGLAFPALQGNVTYPINGIDAPPTPLTPAVGSFRTVRNAVDYLNSQGVDDPSFGGFRTIRLEIAAGYIGESDTFMGPITVLDYPRMAPTRQILLTVASGRTDTIRVTSIVNPLIAINQSLFRFSGCKYFTIDGSNGSGNKNLTLVLPAVFNTSTNKIVDFISGIAPTLATQAFTTNNGVRNCNLTGISSVNNAITFAGVYMGGLATPSNAIVGQNSSNLVQGNFIGGTQFGVYFRGDGIVANMDQGNNISNNIIGGAIAPGGSQNTDYFGGVANAAGIYAQSQVDLIISANTIKNAISIGSNPRGIELGTTPGIGRVLSSSVNINSNIIDNIRSVNAGGAYGIFINFGSDSNNVNRNIMIANNMISGISSLGTSALGTGFGLNPFGIYLNATSIISTNNNSYVGVSLFYNSINLGQGSALTNTNSISACLGIPSFIRSGVISQNNIFQNRLDGAGSGTSNYGVAIGGTINPFQYSNYNNYFTSSSTATIASNLGTNASSFSPSRFNQWFEILSFTKTDTMSITSITPFTNDNNLYIPSTTSANIYQAALPVFNVTLDITGTARNSFQSTMGAHEFTGTYLDNIAPRIFNLTDPTGCQSGPIVLNFNIYDKQLIGDSLYYKINGGTTISIQSTISVGTARRYVLPAQPSGTLIEFRVSAIDFNTPANVGSFPTNKIWDTLSTGITSFPYTNGFEGVNNPTWTSQTITSGATWEIGSLGSSNNPPQGARSGVRSAIFRSSTFPIAGSSAQLVSPCLDFTNLISPTIRFYISQNSDLPNKRDSIQVKVSFGGNIWSNSLRAVERVNGDFALPGYRMVEVCLAAYKTSGLRIALEAYSSGTGQNIQIDDIMIYDDVQAQAISPKLFSQCLRDSIKINITNSDVRYSYRAVNRANGQTLATKDGEGTNMQLGFLPMVVDTMRYFVEASNASSRAVNTGFGGGFITCSNILPDTITAVINRFYNGPFITAGTPFEGSYNAGDANNPDGTKVGSVITYQFVPPAFYTNANYGSLWSIPTIQVYSAGGFVPFTNYTFTAPSASGPGTIRLTAPATMLDSNIVFNYTIRINASGCDSSFSRQLRISIPPTANFNYTPPSTNLCAKNNIVFNAVISTKPANNFPFTFTWLFGDGTFSFVENPTKVYNTSGPFTVKFILTDRYGNSSEKTEVLTILPAPSVDFASNTPCANDSTTFTPTSQPAGSTFLWTMPNTSTQTREVAKFNFAKFDTAYSVRLRITNTSGCFNTAIKSVYVFAKPTANFATTPHCLSNNVPITNTSSIPTGNLGYSWKWGNGQTSLSAAPTYKYPASGTYSATLIVSSPFGCLDSIIKAITIYDRPFTGFNVVNPCVGENDITVFNNTSTFAGGSTNVNYNWNFGDLKSSSIQNPTNAYRGVGSYNVTMLAVDKLNGCRDSVARNITIFYKPVAQFAVSGTGSVCENNEFKVINTSYTIDQGGFKCNWNWGDSKSDTICNVNHIYTAHGFYNATLIVRTPNGCSDTTTIPVTVNLPPIGVITVKTIDSANYPCGKNRKMLTASIPDAESYSWQMGDAAGSTRSGNNQDFVFAARGTYKVKCTIKDQSGCIIITTVDVVIDCAVGIQDVLAAKYDLNAYPNPFSQSTNLSFELPNATDVKVTILDMLGRTIKTIDLGRMQSGKYNQSLEDFGAAGSYLIKVDLDGTSVYKQVIKQ